MENLLCKLIIIDIIHNLKLLSLLEQQTQIPTNDEDFFVANEF